MKVIKFKSKDVAPVLERVASIVSSKNSLVALQNIRIEAIRNEDGTSILSFMGSNGEVWLSMQAPCMETTLDAPIYVDAKSLSQSFKTLSDKDVSISLDDEKHTMVCNYGKGVFKLPYLYDMAFPMPPKSQIEGKGFYEHFMEASRLYAALKTVSYASATDIIRKSMNGVHFDFFTDGMVSVATDGQTLALHKDFTQLSVEPHDMSLPNDVCVLLSRILPSMEDREVKLKFNASTLVVSGDNFRLDARPVDARFVPYENVIPKSSDYVCDVDKEELMVALNHVIPFGTNETALVVLRFEDHSLQISAEDYDYQKSASETVASKHDFQAADFAIGFNGWKFLQVLKEMDCERVKIGFTTPTQAALLSSPEKSEYFENIAVLMPMRLI